MANITTQTIRVDLSTDKVIPSAFTHQNDTARTLVFDMYNGGMPYTMTGNTVKFAYKSPIVNGQYSVIAGASMASGTVSGNKVTVTLPVAYTQISGVGMLTMVITPTSGTVRPVNIRLVVQKSADGANEIAGSSDFPTTLEGFVDEWIDANAENQVENWLNGNASERVHDWVDDALSDAELQPMINTWLDDHPEATTTVEDGAITYAKLNNSLKAFVTPQMYGAKADGTTDDTQAIQDAIDSGNNVYFPKGTYSISDTISIESKNKFTFDASNAIIIYSGNGYAFYFRAVQDCTVKFDSIQCTNADGGCIHMYGLHDGSIASDYIQYFNLYFHQFYAGTNANCVYVENQGTSWINEIRVNEGRFERGTNGIYFLHNSSNGQSHWVISKVGVEGVTNGFKFQRGQIALDNNKHFASFVFEDLRTAEATSVIEADGCVNFKIDGAYDFRTKLTLDNESTKWFVRHTSPTVSAYSVIDGNIVVRGMYGKALSGLNKIPQNANLNDYTNIGEYYIDKNADAATMSNCPINQAGRLTIQYGIGSDYYIVQTFETLTSSSLTGYHIYKRTLTNHNTWSHWYHFKETEEFNLGEFTISASGSQAIALDTSVIPVGTYIMNIESSNNSFWNYVGILSFRNQMKLSSLLEGGAITASLSRTGENNGTLTINNTSTTNSNTVNVYLKRI